MRPGRLPFGLARRPDVSTAHPARTAGLAILLALVLSGAMFLLAGANPLAVYGVVFSYAFADPFGLSATINLAAYLLLCTLAFLVPLRARLWNIGLPGQVFAGALAAFAVAFLVGAHGPTNPVSQALLIVLMGAVAAAAGAAVGGFAGVLRAKLQVNEILVTMMLNWILFWLVANVIRAGGLFMSATAEGESFTLPAGLRPGVILGVPFTAALALAAAAWLDYLFAKTTFGYRVRALGESPASARYAGMSPAALSVSVFLLGGAFGGLAGYHYFGAIPELHRIPGNYGYYGDLAFYGIICALIARGSALGAAPIALLFAGLSLGGRFAQGQFQLPFGVDYAMLGLFTITFVGSELFHRFRIVRRSVPVGMVPGVFTEGS